MLKRAVKNKKGVSEMVAYVLLIVIAVGLSVAVYAYLKVYVPKDKPECQQDIALIVQQKICTISPTGLTLEIQLKNKGLFSVNAAYIRIAPSDKNVREWINPDEAHDGEDADFYLAPIPGTLEQKKAGLAPGASWPVSPPKILTTNKFTGTSSAPYTIEIEPAVYSDDELTVCPKAVITQPVTCAIVP